MTQPTDRPGINHLTSDMLDQLYDRAELAEADRDGWRDRAHGYRTRAKQAEAELAALKSITRGYCPECGRGDCSPTADQWYEQRVRADRHEATLTAIRDELANPLLHTRDPERQGERWLAGRLRAVLDQHGQTTKETT